jgi:hypothetical protein
MPIGIVSCYLMHVEEDVIDIAAATVLRKVDAKYTSIQKVFRMILGTVLVKRCNVLKNLTDVCIEYGMPNGDEIYGLDKNYRFY